MRSASVFATRTTGWELLSTNIQALLPEMPYLQGLDGQLQALLARGRELDSRQEAARAQARELTRLRQEVEKEGENVRARIAAYLRATYGFTSEQLIKFGINPRPRVLRRRADAEAKPAPAAG